MLVGVEDSGRLKVRHYLQEHETDKRGRKGHKSQLDSMLVGVGNSGVVKRHYLEEHKTNSPEAMEVATTKLDSM